MTEFFVFFVSNCSDHRLNNKDTVDEHSDEEKNEHHKGQKSAHFGALHLGRGKGVVKVNAQNAQTHKHVRHETHIVPFLFVGSEHCAHHQQSEAAEHGGEQRESGLDGPNE